MNKKCAKCKVEKPVDDFYFKNKSRNERQSLCIPCWKIYKAGEYKRNKKQYIKRAGINHKIQQQRNKTFLWEYLVKNPCVDCAEKDPRVLQFDHVRGKKKANVTRLVWQGNSIETIQQEIDKCEVRCANCHSRKTFEQFGRKTYGIIPGVTDNADAKGC